MSIINKTCDNCGRRGEVYMPPAESVKNTIITCPSCGNKEDLAYFYGRYSLEEIERREYERLKKRYG